LSVCPDNRCDGSGFVFDEERRRARPCSCRPARMARKRAAALAGRIPRRYRGVSFDREPVPTLERAAPHVVREVRDYVRHVSERIDSGQGIWFTGDVGTGKTTLAMLVSKAALEADHTVAIYSLPRLLATLRETFAEDSRYSLNEFIDRLSSVDLLHIDDVGAEQTSEWVLEQLYTIVNTRYEDGRALVLTTNLVARTETPVLNEETGDPLIDPVTGRPKVDPPDGALRRQIGDRTVSRLKEICGQPLPVFGDDCRPLGGVAFELIGRGAELEDEDAVWEGGTPSRYGHGPLD
jgi:DNA replication protein DnaC